MIQKKLIERFERINSGGKQIKKEKKKEKKNTYIANIWIDVYISCDGQ